MSDDPFSREDWRGIACMLIVRFGGRILITPEERDRLGDGVVTVEVTEKGIAITATPCVRPPHQMTN